MEGYRLSVFGKLVVIAIIVAATYFGYTKMSQVRVEDHSSLTIVTPVSAVETLKANYDNGLTAVKEVNFLAPVKLTTLEQKKIKSCEMPQAKHPTINFIITRDMAWLPIIAANGGYRANTKCYLYSKYGFSLNITISDDLLNIRDRFAAGECQIVGLSLDQLVLIANSTENSDIATPKIVSAVAYTQDADAIVVKNSINSFKELNGKQIVYAQNSPSQYLANRVFAKNGISNIGIKLTSTPAEAAAALALGTVDAAVLHVPDTEVVTSRSKNFKLLNSNDKKSYLIAYVLAGRADFERENPELFKNIAEGVIHGEEMLKSEERGKALSDIAKLYGWENSNLQQLSDKYHYVNLDENREMLTSHGALSLERAWMEINTIYSTKGIIEHSIEYDSVVNSSDR